MDRLRQWMRLKHVRELQERVREAECAIATGRLRAADEALRATLNEASFVAHDRCQAMDEGDRAAWMLADSMAAVIDRKRRRWLPERTLRQEDVEAKQLALRQARLERERCDGMAAELRAQLAVEEQRRTQAVSDDRFAARRHWLRLMKES